MGAVGAAAGARRTAEGAAEAGQQVRTRMTTRRERRFMGAARLKQNWNTIGPSGPVVMRLPPTMQEDARTSKLREPVHPFFQQMPDCAARIPCYTAASRLPALVRRSEPQERPMPDSNAPGFHYGLANLKPAEPEHKVAVTFPDGATREYPRDLSLIHISEPTR